MKEKLISVIIPYFNDHMYIDETLSSVKAQTYSNIEMIIINDGSTESFALQKLQELEAQNEYTILHQNNQGVSAARNLGAKSAKGELILFLDADDILVDTFLSEAWTTLMGSPNCVAVSSWVLGFGKEEFLWKLTGGTTKNFIQGNNSVVTALIHKTTWTQVNGFDESMREGYEDWDFWLRVTHLGYIHIIPKPLFKYRQKDISVNQNAMQKHHQLYFQLIQKYHDTFATHWFDVITKQQQQIHNLIEENTELKQHIKGVYHTWSYRLGDFVLSPLKIIKKRLA